MTLVNLTVPLGMTSSRRLAKQILTYLFLTVTFPFLYGGLVGDPVRALKWTLPYWYNNSENLKSFKSVGNL